MNAEFIAILEYLEREKGIKREILIEAISSALVVASKKSFSFSREVYIDINPKNGEIRAFAHPIVVESVQNPKEEISLKKAQLIDKKVEIGQNIKIEVTPYDFGRIAAQTARQAIVQRLRQLEQEMLYEEFKSRAGEIVSGIIRRLDRNDVILDLGKFEGIIPSSERVYTEDYIIGERIRAYVVAIENGIKGPSIILSRSHPQFIRRLFELEVSEIADQTVEIKSIARDPGFRTKISVVSFNEKVDPVGACVGIRGARVKNVVREINNEKIDIVRWNENPKEFVKEIFKPVYLRQIEVDYHHKILSLVIEKKDLAVAIGKRGQNARLASRLIGWEIDIQEDRSAEKEFAQQMGGATQELAILLDITTEEAKLLILGGMNSIDVILTASPKDIENLIRCTPERAVSIFQTAKHIR